jgi:outer membrane protein assembly factor BamB
MRKISFLLLVISFPAVLFAWTINLSWNHVLDAHTHSAVGIYDVLGDSVPELLIPGNHNLYCFSAAGDSLWTFEPFSNYFPAPSSPIAADIDDDGAVEVVVGSPNYTYALDSLGNIEWEFQLPNPGGVQNCLSSQALGDVNGDGKLEVLTCDTYGYTMYCLGPDSGNVLWQFTPNPAAYIIIATPTVADLDLDGDLEVLIGTIDSGGGGRLFCLDHLGGELWMYETPGSGIGGWQLSSACVGDVNGDDTLEVLSTSNYWGIFCLDYQGNELWNNRYSLHAATYPALADLGNDGSIEAVVGLGSTMFAFDALTGDTVWDFTVAPGYYLVSSPGIGDLNGDSLLEVIFAETKQNAPNDSTRPMWVLDSNGDSVWSYVIGTAFTDPTVGDADHDGFMDFYFGPSYRGFNCWAFESDTLFEVARIEWPTLQHDIHRTGFYGRGGVTGKRISERKPVRRGKKPILYVSPNPFSTTTTINISGLTHGAGGMELKIFDVTGRLVRKMSLATCKLLLGAQTTWDGRSDEGRKLAPGVYFVHFVSGDQSATRKVLLVR